jgi:hypothetical protein
MGTRSAIGYLLPSGRVRAVYCHWDGYPENQLPILKSKYNTFAKVRALIKPGFMSCLETTHTWESEFQRDDNGKALFELPRTNLRDPQPLYHAERGHGEKPKTSGKPFDYWRDMDCEYLYVFNGTWWITYSLRDTPHTRMHIHDET